MYKLAEIRNYNLSDFDVAYIINKTDKFIVIKLIDQYGHYYGYEIDRLEPISKIVYKSKYLDFIQKIMEKDDIDYPIKNMEDMIKCSISMNKLLTVSCYKQNININVKVLGFENGILKCKKINQYGEFTKEYNIDINKIDCLSFDTYCLRMYEKLLKM